MAADAPHSSGVEQGAPRAGRHGLTGESLLLGPHRPEHHGVAPLVDPDALGQQFGAQPSGPALRPVDLEQRLVANFQAPNQPTRLLELGLKSIILLTAAERQQRLAEMQHQRQVVGRFRKRKMHNVRRELVTVGKAQTVFLQHLTVPV